MEPEVNVPKILIAILTTHERNGWASKEVADFLATLPHWANKRYMWQHTFAHNFIPAAGARNTIAKSFKESGADWILMIDNDMAPPINLLDAIQDAPEDAGVVVPKFYRWDETASSLMLCWGLDLPNAPSASTTQNGHRMAVIENKFYELSTCGTGCVFVRPEVFQKVPEPWFFYSFDEMKAMTASEDINFCKKIREHGIKIYGNGKFLVGHHHTVNLAVLTALLYDKAEAKPSFETAERPSPVSVDGGASLPISHQQELDALA